MNIAGSILIMLLILSVLVVVHEFGHYFTARLFKVRVEEFAIFMGPKLFSRVSKKTGTRWSLRAIPMGGFCLLEGEEESVNSNTSFNNKPWYMRAVILMAGSLMNLILAIIIITSFYAFGGYTTNRIGEVKAAPAYDLGFEVGDKLISYDGKKIITPIDYYLFSTVDKDLTSVIGLKKTDGSVKEYTIERQETEGGKSPIGFNFTSEKGNIFEVIWNSILYIVSLVRSIFYTLFWLITGQLGLDAVASPIGMTSIVNDVVTEQNTWAVKILDLLSMTALISANLAVFNLFIIPGLDGGKLLFILIEVIRGGKRISPESEAKISFVGLAVLILLAVVVMGNDIIKLIP